MKYIYSYNSYKYRLNKLYYNKNKWVFDEFGRICELCFWPNDKSYSETIIMLSIDWSNTNLLFYSMLPFLVLLHTAHNTSNINKTKKKLFTMGQLA